MPAPIWPTPAFLWAIPVLMIGSTPESATRRASIPAGVPPKLRAGSVNAGLPPSVIESIRLLFAVASAGVPPTNCTIAGDAAMANSTQPVGLGDGGVAEVRRSVFDGVAGEIEPIHRVGASLEPLVASATEAD